MNALTTLVSENNNLPDYIVTIEEYWLTFILSTVLPILTGLATKRLTSSGVKAWVLLFLTILTGFFTSLGPTGGRFELKAALVGVFVSFITAVGAHYGFLKPSGVTGTDGSVQRSVPGGIGPVVRGETLRTTDTRTTGIEGSRYGGPDSENYRD